MLCIYTLKEWRNPPRKGGLVMQLSSMITFTMMSTYKSVWYNDFFTQGRAYVTFGGLNIQDLHESSYMSFVIVCVQYMNRKLETFCKSI